MSGANNEHWNLMVGGNSTCRIVHLPHSLAWTWKTTVWGTGHGSLVDQWSNNGAGTNDFWRLAQDGNENMAGNQHWNLIPSQ